MPNDLEHDTNEEASQPVQGKETPPEQEPTGREMRRQDMREKRKSLEPWCSAGNPDIWTGDFEDDGVQEREPRPRYDKWRSRR